MRLQVLYLPRRPDDTQPFAVIFDQCEEPLTADELADVRAFGEQCGADGCLTTARTVDLGQDAAEVDVTDELSEHIAAVIRRNYAEPTKVADVAFGDVEARERLTKLGLLPTASERSSVDAVLTSADIPGSKAGEKVRSVWAKPDEDPRANIPGWTPEAVSG